MFEEFSDRARIWIYGFRDALTDNELSIVKNEIENFVTNWKSHKYPVKGSYEILLNRFVILAAESSVSGCSIDSSVSVFKKLRDEHKLDALNQDLVFYKNGTGISALSRGEFQNLVNDDKIASDTVVYNMTPTMLGVFRAGQWEIPFAKSWHGQVFKKSA
ncbi:MAG TPA: hypothetical protein ENO27_05125 [Caldithrix sp.]|nr:hypothetical protein [Calditrichaceae bacterium]HEM49574.1 hypothetical protein [Caldithrix sp.]